MNLLGDPATLLARLLILVFALPVHELAHALTATHYGDDTPRLQGRLTLNPLAHLDPLGSLLIIVVGFGWAKPVQVNPYVLQRRSPLAMMWVSLAGPASNLLLAVLCAIPLRLGLITTSQPFLAQMMVSFILINLILMLFNLIPLAPLDGEKIAVSILPPSMANTLESINAYGPMILILALFVVPFFFHIDLLGMILGPPLNWLYSLLVG